MQDLSPFDYVLKTGPHRGRTIAETIGIVTSNGDLILSKLEEGAQLKGAGPSWLMWYLSHQCHGIAADARPEDRAAIAATLVQLKRSYRIEPYLSWAKEWSSPTADTVS